MTQKSSKHNILTLLTWLEESSIFHLKLIQKSYMSFWAHDKLEITKLKNTPSRFLMISQIINFIPKAMIIVWPHLVIIDSTISMIDYNLIYVRQKVSQPLWKVKFSLWKKSHIASTNWKSWMPLEKNCFCKN